MCRRSRFSRSFALPLSLPFSLHAHHASFAWERLIVTAIYSANTRLPLTFLTKRRHSGSRIGSAHPESHPAPDMRVVLMHSDTDSPPLLPPCCWHMGTGSDQTRHARACCLLARVMRVLIRPAQSVAPCSPPGGHRPNTTACCSQAWPCHCTAVACPDTSSVWVLTQAHPDNSVVAFLLLVDGVARALALPLVIVFAVVHPTPSFPSRACRSFGITRDSVSCASKTTSRSPPSFRFSSGLSPSAALKSSLLVLAIPFCLFPPGLAGRGVLHACARHRPP